MTRLCVAIFVNDVAKARRDIATAIESGADMIELRIDEAHSLAVGDLLKASSVPCIVTCRPTWEGGRSELGDEERVEAIRAASEKFNPLAGPPYVDVELETLNNLDEYEVFRLNRARTIVSAHDFTGRPDDLIRIFVRLNESGASVVKLVWTARTIRDNLEAFELLANKVAPATIALCMGEHGLISRILAKKFGAFLTFASLAQDSGTAPGQVTIADMKNLYRWDAINAKTKVYGVVASPVMHSMSPAIHNVAFDATGHDGVYLPMLVNPGYESFKAFMETFLEFTPLDLSGLSVTLPHKENALRYLKEKGAQIEPLAQEIGAVNTIVVKRSEVRGQRPAGGVELRGMNTDYAAILDSITAKMAITREQLGDYRVAVIGAGGTGRTAVAALAHYGATVVVYNRTKERADELAVEFDGKSGRVVAARIEKLCDSCCHIFINTTSVGMYPNIDASPLGDRAPDFTADTVVFDTIYNPMKTRLLQQAEAAGAKTIGGVEMFVRQAVAQFEAWTGKTAPVDVMRKVIEKRLSRPV